MSKRSTGNARDALHSFKTSADNGDRCSSVMWMHSNYLHNLPTLSSSARYMPQNPDLIATKTVGGEVHVFDRTKHVSQPAEGAPSKPQIRLRGHSQEGYSLALLSRFRYGVAWNPKDVGVIIDGGAQSSHLDPERVFRGHSAFVEVGTIPADRIGLRSDVEQPNTGFSDQSSDKAAHSVVAHADEINSVAFNQASDYVVATGSADKVCLLCGSARDVNIVNLFFVSKPLRATCLIVALGVDLSSCAYAWCAIKTVALWDIRNLKVKLHSLEAHKDQVFQVSWNPHFPTILASASADRRINVWDLSRIGDEQTPEEMEDGPPELLVGVAFLPPLGF
ncbi:MAG: WD40-repeat-containing domain protein [Olpidium bornovanus]|uniref:WD40-repeat-containing domain protein n=1 Tax=Olpidium bornovanus TaxID=278681 RepID=A0A8H7ZZM4_9FUNG|nr:MAG: WD40-repeat-containing domain protein [Olpidium bornovanus]